jgi:hypothetical protein
MVITGGADNRVATPKLLVAASFIWSVMVRARVRFTNLIDGKIAMAAAG